MMLASNSAEFCTDRAVWHALLLAGLLLLMMARDIDPELVKAPRMVRNGAEPAGA